ncbi:cytochrome P450, partial [Colletotrichum sp. SAR 10_96]
LRSARSLPDVLQGRLPQRVRHRRPRARRFYRLRLAVPVLQDDRRPDDPHVPAAEDGPKLSVTPPTACCRLHEGLGQASIRQHMLPLSAAPPAIFAGVRSRPVHELCQGIRCREGGRPVARRSRRVHPLRTKHWYA